MKVLVTGGAGFIGHHIIEHILRNTDWTIVSLDRLDTSGNLNRLSDSQLRVHNSRERTSLSLSQDPVSKKLFKAHTYALLKHRKIGHDDVFIPDSFYIKLASKFYDLREKMEKRTMTELEYSHMIVSELDTLVPDLSMVKK